MLYLDPVTAIGLYLAAWQDSEDSAFQMVGGVVQADQSQCLLALQEVHRKMLCRQMRACRGQRGVQAHDVAPARPVECTTGTAMLETHMDERRRQNFVQIG